jgi:hypothetical protein
VIDPRQTRHACDRAVRETHAQLALWAQMRTMLTSHALATSVSETNEDKIVRACLSVSTTESTSGRHRSPVVASNLSPCRRP